MHLLAQNDLDISLLYNFYIEVRKYQIIAALDNYLEHVHLLFQHEQHNTNHSWFHVELMLDFLVLVEDKQKHIMQIDRK